MKNFEDIFYINSHIPKVQFKQHTFELFRVRQYYCRKNIALPPQI